MRANLININRIFTHKSYHVSLIEAGEILKISCAKDDSKDGWYQGMEILLSSDLLNYIHQCKEMIVIILLRKSEN